MSPQNHGKNQKCFMGVKLGPRGHQFMKKESSKTHVPLEFVKSCNENESRKKAQRVPG